jgi:hypothetical protein
MYVATEGEAVPDTEDLRRGPRVETCCRANVHDAFGAWTAIADDMGARGCRLVTLREPRVGTILVLTLSSDLFEAELRVSAQVIWARHGRVGVMFAPEDAAAAAAWYVRLSTVDELGARIRLARPPVRVATPRVRFAAGGAAAPGAH